MYRVAQSLVPVQALLSFERTHIWHLKKNMGLVRELDYVYEVGKNPLLAYTMLHTIDKFQRTPFVAPEIIAQFEGQMFKRDEPRYVLTPSRF
jgi:hypothetical protein